MSTPDTLDYALVAAVSVLAYLQLPWRPQIHHALRSLVRGFVSTVTDVTVSPELAVVGLALTDGVVLVLLVEVLPGRNGPR